MIEQWTSYLNNVGVAVLAVVDEAVVEHGADGATVLERVLHVQSDADTAERSAVRVQ